MSDSSEFSHGSGVIAPQGRGHVVTQYERHIARFHTDTANPDADEAAVLEPGVSVSTTDKDGRYVAGNVAAGGYPLVVETGPAPLTHIVPSTYNPGHDPEGLQDGAGQAWRDTIPGPPITDEYRGEQ